MYTIRYSQEAQNYFAENRFDYHVAGVHVELKLLADTLNGLPGDKDSCYYRSETNRVYWLVERHFIVYRIGVNRLLESGEFSHHTSKPVRFLPLSRHSLLECET